MNKVSTDQHSESSAPFSDRSKVRLTVPSFLTVLTACCLGFGAWVSLRGDVAQQGRDLAVSRLETQKQVDDAKRQIEDLRTETRLSLNRVYEEQRKQLDTLTRVDENVRILRGTR